MYGVVLRDNLTMAGITVQAPFLAAVSVAPAISSGVFDGVMGFGMPALSKPGLEPIWKSILHQESLPENVFSFYLNPQFNFHVHTGYGGELTMGGVDARRIADGNLDSIVYTDVIPFADTNQILYWQFRVSLKVNGRLLVDPLTGEPQEFSGMSDTGTSAVSVPQVIWDQLGIDDAFASHLCGTIPSLTFIIEGQEFPLPAADLRVPTNILGLHCNSLIEKLPAALEDSVASPNHTFPIIMGDAFLRRYLSVYDWGKLRVGFAAAAPAPVQF